MSSELCKIPSKRVLVVGAGGFVGGYLVSEGLNRGYEVWAGVRSTTKRDRLADPRVHIVEFDFDDPASLAKSMTDALPEGKWDYIVFNLGATKVIKYADFNRINHDYLRSFTGALHQAGKVPELLVFISSLSVMGPHDSKAEHYVAMNERMVPQPNTRYGASKLKAELWLATSQIPYVVLRATGVYGPWDRDYFLMIESIKKGFDFGVGYRRQLLTFIYGADLARAVYAAFEHGQSGETYHITESRAYSQREFRKIVMKKLGKKLVLPVKLPLWMVGVVCKIAEKISALSGKPSTLNSDKFRILKQRNWNCSPLKAEEQLGFRAATSLEDGIAESIDWYRNNGWLK